MMAPQREQDSEDRVQAQPWLDPYPRAKAFVEEHWWWAIPVGTVAGIAALSVLAYFAGEIFQALVAGLS